MTIIKEYPLLSTQMDWILLTCQINIQCGQSFELAIEATAKAAGVQLYCIIPPAATKPVDPETKEKGKYQWSLQPYLDLLCDEIKWLHGKVCYDGFRRENFNLQEEPVLYIMDFQAFSKVSVTPWCTSTIHKINMSGYSSHHNDISSRRWQKKTFWKSSSWYKYLLMAFNAHLKLYQLGKKIVMPFNTPKQTNKMY